MKPGWRRSVNVQVSGLYTITLGSVARYGSTSSSFREGSPITMILPGSARQGRIFVRMINSRNIIASWLEHVTGHLGDARTGHLNHPINNLFFSQEATFTKPIITGTSTSGPITAANACPEAMPNTATATAIASSKLLLAAVKAMLAVLGELAPIFLPI